MPRPSLVVLVIWGMFGVGTSQTGGIDSSGSIAQPQAVGSDMRRREAELKSLTEAEPRTVANWIELVRLQEKRGGNKDAERTLKAAIAANDGDLILLNTMCDFLLRTNQLSKAIPVLEDLVKRDHSNTLFYRSALLRVKGLTESNLRRRNEAFAEAGRLMRQAYEAPKTKADPIAPLTLPPLPEDDPIDGRLPARVGGSVQAPTKIRDVRPYYPLLALNAQVSGAVVLDIVIDTQGNVRSATVVRSVQMLDAAAIEAVMRWKFQPPLVDGVAAPVVASVTVTFSLR